MRGVGNAGVIKAGRPCLASLDLRPFGTSSRSRFAAALDEATDELRQAFPRRARHWGLARKGINIFLRECLYIAYTRAEYALGVSESFFEVPLDSITAAKLRERYPSLPAWEGVRYLTPTNSVEYQLAARRIAARHRFAPVHLDALWWGAVEREA